MSTYVAMVMEAAMLAFLTWLGLALLLMEYAPFLLIGAMR